MENVDDLDEKGLPPEGLWVSPDGEAIQVIEHLISIQHEPHRFGLSPKDVRGVSIQRLHDIAVDLIKGGWTRFRFLSGTWNFEVDSARSRISLIEEILVTHRAYPQELVVVGQAKPKRTYQGTVAQFYDRTMFRHYELGRKVKWLLT